MLERLHSWLLLFLATLASSSGGSPLGGRWISGNQGMRRRMPLGRQSRQTKQWRPCWRDSRRIPPRQGVKSGSNWESMVRIIHFSPLELILISLELILKSFFFFLSPLRQSSPWSSTLPSLAASPLPRSCLLQVTSDTFLVESQELFQFISFRSSFMSLIHRLPRSSWYLLSLVVSFSFSFFSSSAFLLFVFGISLIVSFSFFVSSSNKSPPKAPNGCSDVNRTLASPSPRYKEPILKRYKNPTVFSGNHPQKVLFLESNHVTSLIISSPSQSYSSSLILLPYPPLPYPPRPYPPQWVATISKSPCFLPPAAPETRT